MKTIDIKINKGEYLKSPVPSNCIFCKNLTGIGATHIELNIAQRHSIVIEPNVPVIDGKSRSNKNILGVREGISEIDVIKYLRNDVKWKKIVTTPESFNKVINALENLNIDFKNDYFLLIDECDRMITDIDFRKSMILPLDYFFDFKQKAFVSATALIPSDPRFKDFDLINVVPTYDISKNIDLITTNHTIHSLVKVLNSSKADKIFIFLNSLIGIADIIKNLKIDNISSVFTSKDSVRDFFEITDGVNPKHVTDLIDPSKFSKINFLTSRFFSAVDVIVEENLDVIMLSDPSMFTHSILDPFSDIVQIIGRFRSQEFINNITVIANANNPTEYISQDAIEDVFKCGKAIREFIKSLLVSTDNLEVKKYLKVIINILSDKAFFNEDFSPNHFMMDNYRLENLVSSYYDSTNTLTSALSDITIKNSDYKYFNVNHIDELHDLSKIGTKIKSSRKRFKALLEDVILQMNNVKEYKRSSYNQHEYEMNNFSEIEAHLYKNFREMYEIFLNEGEDRLREIGKSMKSIKDYYYLNYENGHLDNIPLIRDLYREFKEGSVVDKSSALDTFFKISQKYDNSLKRNLTSFGMFFEFIPHKSGGLRTIEIKKYRFSVSK